MYYPQTGGVIYYSPPYTHCPYHGGCACGYWYGWCRPVPQQITIKVEHIHKVIEQPKSLSKKKSSKEW